MYKSREDAADYLTNTKGVKTTAQGLADKASRGDGPAYSIINGRALYMIEALDSWVAAQAARPVIRRKAREQAAASAGQCPDSPSTQPIACALPRPIATP